MADAIAADWLNKFNIKTVHDRRIYSTIRPGLVNRTFPVLRMQACCDWPATWPIEFIWSTQGRGGYNHGLEVPLAAEINAFKENNSDPVLLNDAGARMRQYLYDWALLPGVVQTPGRMIYDSEQVESWTMKPFLAFRHDGIHDLQTVQLK